MLKNTLAMDSGSRVIALELSDVSVWQVYWIFDNFHPSDWRNVTAEKAVYYCHLGCDVRLV